MCLLARGMVDANGQLFMEYPWAEDGLDLWSAMHQYFANYVQLYYRSDEDVLQDSELQSWWQELQVSRRKASTSIHLKTSMGTHLPSFPPSFIPPELS